MDTKRARIARKVQLTSRQKELIIGSILGDAYLVKTTRGFAFRESHSIKQKTYVDWKYRQLEGFTNSPPATHKYCYYFRTISHPFFSELREIFYVGRCKIIPPQLEDWLTPLVLSVWIMDDGSRDGNQLRINTQSFSYEEHELLICFLKAKLGITATINRDKDRFRLRVCAASMPRVRQIVAPYIISSMQYKLSP